MPQARQTVICLNCQASSAFHVSRFTFHDYTRTMSKPKQVPAALTIAGSDSGGGAGIQADLKTFAALGVHGTSAITCITAQNPKRVLGIQACKPEMVRQQIEAVFAEFSPAAVKTGMLFSTEIIRVVATFFARRHGAPPLVVDPVMISTSGAQLLKNSAINLLKSELLPLASVVTPNVDEAECLLNRPLKSLDHLRSAAKELHERFGCAALVKGGHLRGEKKAMDVFYNGKSELLLSAPFVKRVNTHGTGCTMAAAITANLALGHGLPAAVRLAKEHITNAIAKHWIANGHAVLNNFWQ
jgi:hydroxymethylpyrimidine/phosphomethylpyrimidine kinase